MADYWQLILLLSLTIIVIVALIRQPISKAAVASVNYDSMKLCFSFIGTHVSRSRDCLHILRIQYS